MLHDSRSVNGVLEPTALLEPLCAAAVDYTSGSMICVFPQADEQAAMATADGQPADTLHVTLAFLPNGVDGDGDELAAMLMGLAAVSLPMAGEVGGVGRFKDGGDGAPIIALPDVVGLAELRQGVCDVLKESGTTYATSHGWTPHITLGYGNGEYTDPLGQPLTFTHVAIVDGPLRTDFPLGTMSGVVEQEEPMEDYAADAVTAAAFSAKERRDLAKRGLAMPDGSFPIRNATDLGNAIRDVGRASDRKAAVAWIRKRAAALGLQERVKGLTASMTPPDAGFALVAAGAFDPTAHPRAPKGVREGGRFVAHASGDGNYTVTDTATGEAVAETTTKGEAQTIAEDANATPQPDLAAQSVAERDLRQVRLDAAQVATNAEHGEPLTGIPTDGLKLALQNQEMSPAATDVVTGEIAARESRATDLRDYAEGVRENLLDDEPDFEGEFPVVEDYLADADRIEAGEEPLHEHTREVLADLPTADSMADVPAPSSGPGSVGAALEGTTSAQLEQNAATWQAAPPSAARDEALKGIANERGRRLADVEVWPTQTGHELIGYPGGTDANGDLNTVSYGKFNTPEEAQQWSRENLNWEAHVADYSSDVPRPLTTDQKFGPMAAVSHDEGESWVAETPADHKARVEQRYTSASRAADQSDAELVDSRRRGDMYAVQERIRQQGQSFRAEANEAKAYLDETFGFDDHFNVTSNATYSDPSAQTADYSSDVPRPGMDAARAAGRRDQALNPFGQKHDRVTPWAPGENDPVAMKADLIANSGKMGDTEFSVKRRRLEQAGGYWPNSLDEWSKPEGMALSREIAAARTTVNESADVPRPGGGDGFQRLAFGNEVKPGDTLNMQHPDAAAPDLKTVTSVRSGPYDIDPLTKQPVARVHVGFDDGSSEMLLSGQKVPVHDAPAAVRTMEPGTAVRLTNPGMPGLSNLSGTVVEDTGGSHVRVAFPNGTEVDRHRDSIRHPVSGRKVSIDHPDGPMSVNESSGPPRGTKARSISVGDRMGPGAETEVVSKKFVTPRDSKGRPTQDYANVHITTADGVEHPLHPESMHPVTKESTQVAAARRARRRNFAQATGRDIENVPYYNDQPLTSSIELSGITASAAGMAPDVPLAEWFERPKVVGPLEVTPEGQVSGYLAYWGTCHTGLPGRCQEPPRSSDGLPFFNLAAVRTTKGTVGAGKLTLGTGHAAITAGLTPATVRNHYDNTGTVAADVTAGQDEHGIWIAGAIRPELDAAQVRALERATVSGDWRRIKGKHELIAALAVNVPGFPIPRPQAALVASANGEETVEALVAAGVLCDCVDPDFELDELVASAVPADRQRRLTTPAARA